MNANSGAAAMARSINRAFLDVGVTGLIQWPLVDSMPPYLPAEDRGLLFANQPWSGYYQVNLMTWAIAQTTQFVHPGWRYVKGAYGQLAGSGAAGTYVSYAAPTSAAWTMVAQTSLAKSRQRVVVHVDGRLGHSTVHVWSTNLDTSARKAWFVQDASVRPRNGTFRYTLRPDYIYTFTTTTGQHKGNAASPKAKPMPLNYTARPDAAAEPLDLSAQNGTFSYTPNGTVIEQLATQTPVYWQIPDSAAFPYAVVGGSDWANYRVSTQVRFTAPGQSAGVISRYQRLYLTQKVNHFYGYQFVVSDSGSWQLVQDLPKTSPVTLASGEVGPLGVGTWHTITLSADGPVLTASIDSSDVASVLDVGTGSSGFSRGLAGISTGGWYQVDFRQLTVRDISIGSYHHHHQ
jgi:hypothetical protein